LGEHFEPGNQNLNKPLGDASGLCGFRQEDLLSFSYEKLISPEATGVIILTNSVELDATY